MDNIKAAIRNLQDSISIEKITGKDVEDALMQLHSTVNLLNSFTLPPNTFKKLSELLRHRLLPLYQASLTRALQYSASVLEFIQENKLLPALNVKDESLKHLWEQLLTSLISGVLDYLDQSPDTQRREKIASILYPILSRIYFSPLTMFLPELNGGLLSAAYQLLVTTVEPQARNAARLRDHGISGKCLGLTLSQIRDFLAIESLLDIICTLIPPIRSGLEKRSQFIKEVFDSDLFQCSKSVIKILESIADGDWNVTAVKIIEALAKSDISFPQPFDASSLMVCGISVNSTPPFYVDKYGFLANLDQDGKVETLHVPFHTVTKVIGSSINNAEFSIVLVLTMPPIIGTEPLSVPSGRGLSVSWRLKKSQLDKFADAIQDRKLILLNSTTRKLSLPGTDIAFNLPVNKQPQPLVSTQERIHDMAQLLAMPSSPGLPERTEPNSPNNQQSNFSSQKAENITPSTELATAIVEDEVEHPVLSVFLDHSGNLSFTNPSHPANEASTEQPLGDRTLLNVSSTSKLCGRPVQRAMKNQHDLAAVSSRVTRFNTAPQNIPKPSTNKKSAATTNPPAVKPHTNLQISQTTLDAQLDGVILDKFPDPKEPIPPFKIQKRRSVTAGKMAMEAAKPLDEPRQVKDSSLERTSPVDPNPESRKQFSHNMEDSEVTHVSDHERPTKRVRIDHEKPSHPILPYPKKRYGRNGRTSSPRAESPAVPNVDFDKIPEPKLTAAVERPKSRVLAMKSKHVGKKTDDKPATPKKRKQEHQDVKVDVKLTAPDISVSLAKAKRDNQATTESISEIGPHPSEQTGQHSTSLANAPSITQSVTTQGHNENNIRKEIQTVPWEDKNVLQKAEEPLDTIRLPSTSTSKETLIENDETLDHDHSLTLLVDYKPEKGVVESSIFVPDVVMIDLTQDSPISTNVFSKSGLKEDKPMAKVRPALPGKQTHKVKVEILSPPPLPTKDRHNDRPSVSFALPIQLQRYPRAEISTPARKQTIEDSKSHNHDIRRSWEKSVHNYNKATSRGVHQQKVEEKKYEQPEEPIEKIAGIIRQIGETVVHQISHRFESVRDDLHAGHRSILEGTLVHIGKMHEESATHATNMIQLEEEYALICSNILEGFDDIRENAKNVSICMKNVVKDHNQQSLSKKFPSKLFDKRTGILLNARIG